MGPPPIWKGGILADEMGLGKTLSIIALIASDNDSDIENVCSSSYHTDGQVVATTLVVVPPNGTAFASTWTKPDALTSSLQYFPFGRLN